MTPYRQTAAARAGADLMEKVEGVKGRSLLADARQRLFRNKAAVISNGHDIFEVAQR